MYLLFQRACMHRQYRRCEDGCLSHTLCRHVREGDVYGCWASRLMERPRKCQGESRACSSCEQTTSICTYRSIEIYVWIEMFIPILSPGRRVGHGGCHYRQIPSRNTCRKKAPSTPSRFVASRHVGTLVVVVVYSRMSDGVYVDTS